MTWVISLFGVGGVVGMGDWRRGLLFLLLVGFLQDPIRKILPGTPVYMQVAVLSYLGVVVLCAVLQNANFRVSSLYGDDSRLKQAWTLFVLLVALQCAHAYLRFGNPVLAGLGGINYLSPVAIMVVAATFARSGEWIRQFIRVYLYLAIPIALTVYLSFYYQDDWEILKSLGRLTGQPLLIYDQGTVLFSNSGLMRSGEIAAWHAGTAVMLLITLAASDKRAVFRLVVGVSIALLIGAIILTGRRKMLMAVAIFIGAFLAIMAVYGRGSKKVAVVGAVLSAGAAAYIWLQPDAGPTDLYEARSLSVFGDAFDRIALAWDLAESGFRRGGLLGLGAGVSAQGAQHFGGGTRIVGGAGEAGGGKLLVELGIVGLVIVGYLIRSILGHFRSVLRTVSAESEDAKVLFAGLAAMLIANSVTFIVATQVLGDMFILLLVGLFLGFMLALERQSA